MFKSYPWNAKGQSKAKGRFSKQLFGPLLCVVALTIRILKVKVRTVKENNY